MRGPTFSATPFSFLIIYISLVFLIHLPSFDGAQENIWYATCGTLFSCGKIAAIDYPFYGGDRPEECGYPGLELDCDDDETTIEIMNVEYVVRDINQDTQILTIAREDLVEDICLEEFENTTLDSGLFEYASEYSYITFLYGCPPRGRPAASAQKFNCRVKGIAYRDGYVQIGSQGPGKCHASVVVPVKKNTSLKGVRDFVELLSSGFEVKYKVDNIEACNECKNSRGRCRFDRVLNRFTCLSSRDYEPPAAFDEPTGIYESIPQPPPAAVAASGAGMIF